MAITRAKQSSLRTGVTKYDNLRAGLPFTPTIGTATDGGTGTTVSVAFTGNNTAGLTYTALSTPGSLTGTSTTSPITVSGLTSGTAYTFQVNAANSAGTSPYSAASNSVTPVTPSSYESIATATGTGSSGSITFSNIPGTYQHLQLRMNGLTSTGGVSVFLRYNSDSGSNYVHHWLYGNGTTATASAQTARTENRIIGTDNGTSTTSPSSAIVDIHNYTSTSQYKTIRAFTGVDKNGTGEINLMSGLWLSTSAISSITVFLASVNWTSDSTFALYGIN